MQGLLLPAQHPVACSESFPLYGDVLFAPLFTLTGKKKTGKPHAYARSEGNRTAAPAAQHPTV
jgi:hypothetical protein